MEPMMIKKIFAGTASLIVALTIALPLAVFAADDSGDFVRLVAPLESELSASGPSARSFEFDG